MNEFPEEAGDFNFDSEDTLKFNIKSISPDGQVIIKFSEPVFEFDKLNSREIGVQMCQKADCEDESLIKDEVKDWVQVDIIAGESSDESKLGFSSDTFFTDSMTMKIEIKFENAIDVSLFSAEDKLRVELWGPFLSARNKTPVAEKDRVRIK